MQDVLSRELVDSNEDQRELQKVSLLHGPWRRKIEVLLLLTGSDEQGPQQLDLKPLPVELKYAFLGGKMHCPVVISSLLIIHKRSVCFKSSTGTRKQSDGRSPI